jgi:hypothetical protein
MATLINCINNLFAPGNIPSTPGTTTPVPTLLEPSLDFSKSQNSQYIAVI